MPLTVITLKNVPSSLRGDLTKWMQEIAQGVYVGNFNSKVREQLWGRVTQNVAIGEATLSYAYRNEIGYQFETYNTNRTVVDYDGIPLVKLMNPAEESEVNDVTLGYSDASKFRKARKYSRNQNKYNSNSSLKYVVVDIETTGLDYKTCKIIEIGAVKVYKGKISHFQMLIKIDFKVPAAITELTGITNKLINDEGVPLPIVLRDFIEFIEDFDIVGYGVDFDMKFLNEALKGLNQEVINNRIYDLIRYVKKEKQFLSDYKLQTALIGYGINEEVTHRALNDAELIYQLSEKVNKFLEFVNRK